MVYSLARVMYINLASLLQDRFRELSSSAASRRRQAGEAASRQEDCDAFQNAVIGMARSATDSRLCQVNHALCQMLGYTPAELLCRTLSDIIHPEDLNQDRVQRQRLLAGEIRTYQGETRYIHKSGSLVWVHATWSLALDAHRKPRHFFLQAQDISERRRMAQSLRHGEDRLAAITELSFDWYWEQDEHFRFIEVSGKANNLARFAIQNVTGMTRWELDHRHMDDSVWAAHKHRLARHEPFRDFEMTLLDDKGQIRYECISGVPIFNASGEFTGYRGIGRDMTEMRRVTDALRASEAQLREITHTMPALIGYVDASEHFGFHNPGFERALGLTYDQIHGKSLRTVVGEALYEVMRPLLCKLQSGHPVEFEHTFPLADASRSDYAFRCFPRYEDANARKPVIGFYSLGTDITECKRSEHAIRSLNAELEDRVLRRTSELEAANRELEAFSYSVSHDLRAPLITIDGFCKLLQGKSQNLLDDKARHYLSRICAASGQMGELIDGLLALAKVSRGPLNLQLIDLSALALKLSEECREREPGRHVEVSIQPGLQAQGDAFLLSVALQNLLGNAWKYSARVPAAKIEVGSQTSANGEKVYFVKDNGAGFDMAYVSKLFGTFQRLHASSDFAGTGVGLANVKRVVERHGGRVWAEGRVDEGATLYFTLGQNKRPPDTRLRP